MKKKLAVFDIEVLINSFICCVVTTDRKEYTFEISERRNDYEKMVDFFTTGEYIFVGYNCIHYDTPILCSLIMNRSRLQINNYYRITQFAKEMSDEIINGDPKGSSWKKYKYANLFHQIDLMTMMASKALRVSLKSLQVAMCYPNLEEFLVDWDMPIDRKDLDKLISYCINDVNSTFYLMTLLKDEIKFRVGVQKEFKIDCLSKDGVGIGVDIFTKYICQELGTENENELRTLVDVDPIIRVKDLIIPQIKFKTKKFQALLDWYSSVVVDLHEYEELSDKQKEARYKFVVNYNNMSHSYGLGGMHSQNKPKIYEACENYYLSDEDVASYYPSLALEWGFGPKGFKKAFLKVMAFLKSERIIAKAAKDKVKDTLYKLALNSILGNLKNRYSPFYDPAANMAICINGQLLLSMLIEECELAGIECLSSNTDGATFRVPRKKKGEYEIILDNWQKMSRMILEENRYEKMVVLAVNEYIAFKEGYSEIKDQIDFYPVEKCVNFNFTDLLLKDDPMTALKNKFVKEKGKSFITYPRLGKGMQFLVVARALQNYYGKGIPIERTIQNFSSVHQYLKTEKVGKQYEVEWNGEKQQNINRFFIAPGAPYLYKIKQTVKRIDGVDQNIVSKQNLMKGWGVQIVNKVDVDADYEINQSFYESKVKELIDKLEPKQLTLF